MYDFNYHRPDTLDEAVALFEGADDPAWIAGGQTLPRQSLTQGEVAVEVL